MGTSYTTQNAQAYQPYPQSAYQYPQRFVYPQYPQLPAYQKSIPQAYQQYPQLPAYPISMMQAYQQYPQLTHQRLALPRRSVATPQVTYPRVTRAIPAPSSKRCSYCHGNLAYVPTLQQWCCQYCQRPFY